MRYYKTFQGHETKQLDLSGITAKSADPEKWYYEPLDYDGDVLWSNGYETEEECNNAARREKRLKLHY